MHGHNTIYITISFLIILGGIGFPILVNLYETVTYEVKRIWHHYIKGNKRMRRKIHLYNLNTRIVLIMTAILLIVGTVVIVVLEWNNALQACRPRISGYRHFSMPHAPAPRAFRV